MELKQIQRELKEKICQEIDLLQEGEGRYRIFSPFTFDDGDSYTVFLKNRSGRWILTDEGHTYMHLSYDMDLKGLEKGARQKLLSSILTGFSISDDNGELVHVIEGSNFGDALFSYFQALIKITDLSYLSREIVKSTFMDDFNEYITSIVPHERISFAYHDAEHDPKGVYSVDCRINGMKKPIFLFGVQNDSKCKDVTISILQYERWGLAFQPVAVFEDQESISRKVLARFSDVAEKQFSSLSANKDRISSFLHQHLQAN
jgi:hypothetical protein